MSTEFPSKDGIIRQWHVIDAQEAVLGKIASKAAMLLMGKTKPSYTPFLDTGDHVIVINADKVKVSGRKEEDKMYRHFTGYPIFGEREIAVEFDEEVPGGAGVMESWSDGVLEWRSGQLLEG